MGDFWGIETYAPEEFDRDGVSLVLINTIKGKELIANLPLESFVSDYKTAIASNPPLIESVTRPRQADIFEKDFPKYGIRSIGRTLVWKPSILNRIISRLKK